LSDCLKDQWVAGVMQATGIAMANLI